MTCEEQLNAANLANEMNFSEVIRHQKFIEKLYRLLYPEEAPWGPVETSPGVSHSPVDWSKIEERIAELQSDEAETSWWTTLAILAIIFAAAAAFIAFISSLPPYGAR